MFEEVNVAVDHNQLLMDIMERVARRHHLRVLLHEKPFAGVNGSGKHNNWSMSTNTGVNLLSPSDTPRRNIRFLTFFINTLKALHEHADLLRSTVASASNDHRLGANEAPPAIVSAFIGETMTRILDDLETRNEKDFLDEDTKQDLKLSIHSRIPDLMLDNTDRNRTSPFAFTGNKFEIRMVGSMQNCAAPMIVMNTIVGQQLAKFRTEVDGLIKGGMKKDSAILHILKRLITECKDIRFEGNGYSQEWEDEAARRGLGNHKTTPEALDAMISAKTVALFKDARIYNDLELHARHEIQLHQYILKIQIEGRVLGDLCTQQVIPASVRYQNELLESINGLKNAGIDGSVYATQLELVKAISTHITAMRNGVVAMIAARKAANDIEDIRAQAFAYCTEVRGKYFDEIRYHADKLEELVDDQKWTLPKFRELLFVR